jgi:hypothetical protein
VAVNELHELRQLSESDKGKLIILKTEVGQARVGCDAVRWQGATLLRARAREEEQRGKPAAAQLNRVCSALPQVVNDVV